MNLLLEFNDYDSGHIYVDGNEINKYNKASYRKNLGIVLQTPALFAGTIKSNVTMGRDYPDSMVEDVIHKVDGERGAHESALRREEQIAEEVPQLADVGKTENTETDNDDQFGVNVFDNDRDLLEPFLAQERFDQYEQSEIKSPDDVVPRSAVP